MFSGHVFFNSSRPVAFGLQSSLKETEDRRCMTQSSYGLVARLGDEDARIGIFLLES